MNRTIWGICAVQLAVAVTDLATGRDLPLTTAYLIPVLLMALVAGPRPVAWFAAASVVASVTGSLTAGLPVDGRELVRFLVVAVPCAAAVIFAAGRERLQREAAANTSLLNDLQRKERELTGILEALADAVHVHDATGRTVYANQAAADLVRLPSPDDMLASLPGEMAASFDIRDEQGRPLGIDAFPGRQIFVGRTDPAPLLARSVDRRTGEEFWSVTKATAITGEDGRPLLAVNVIEDVTDAKRAELGQRLLAAAGEVLGASMDLERSLARLSDLAVPGLADWCWVDLPERGRVSHAAVSHADSGKRDVAEELRHRYPIALDADHDLVRVLQHGRTIVRSLCDADLVAAAQDERHLDLLRQVGEGHVLIAPMSPPGGTPIGALTVLRNPRRSAFSDGEVALVEELARRAATAVLNARLYEERGVVAEALQRSLLPRALPTAPGLEMRADYRPAGEAIEVGGDFYDAYPVPDGWLLVIGDVTGKGAAAAALTGLARAALEAVGTLTGRADLALGHLDALLARRGDDELALCSAAIVHLQLGDQPRAEVRCAGHPPPLLLRDGVVTAIGAQGPLLGAMPGSSWQPTAVPLQIGDTIVLRTDGITDAVGAGGERLGEDRLQAGLAGVAAGDADAAVAAIRATVDGWTSGQARDDEAVVVVSITGATTPPSIKPPPLGGASVRLALPGDPVSVGAARRTLEDFVGRRLSEAQLQDARLMLSELASNAVRHAAPGPYFIAVDLDARRLHVSVDDAGEGFIATRNPAGSVNVNGNCVDGELGEGGRGLAIVDKLAARWGVERLSADGGSRVWFELDRV